MRAILVFAFLELACCQTAKVNFLSKDLIEKRLRAYTAKERDARAAYADSV